MKKHALGITLYWISSSSFAATFTVDTTSDLNLTACTAAPGDCSLRGALNLANGTSVLHLVQFNIPMSDSNCVAATGVCTIRPQTSLPDINANSPNIVVIDGFTQAGALANTLANTSTSAGALNTQLKIQLSGNACTDCRGISFVRPGTVRGLVINEFIGNAAAISFAQLPDGGAVEGCFIGTDVNGNVALPNSVGVVFSGNPFGGGTSTQGRVGGLLPEQRNLISGQINEGIIAAGISHSILGNLIGTNAAGNASLGNGVGVSLAGGTGFVQFIGNGTAAGRNVVSGNRLRGIGIGGAGATNGHRVTGNFIGTDLSGARPLGNGLGVQLDASVSGVQPPLVGGTSSGQGNVIAFNVTQGVATRNQRGHAAGNSIFGNGQLGISSRTGDNGSAGGRLANDTGDPDAPANNGQNFPEISAFSVTGSNVNLSYRVDSTTGNSAYPIRVEFYKADGDEGRTLLFTDSYLTAEAQSIKSLTNRPLPSGVTLSADDVIVATATDANDNTSEFSYQPLTMVIDIPVPSACGGNVRIFCDAFESDPQRSIEVTVRATSPLFKPNGNVRLTDSRGASCTLTLLPTATALTSSGRCVLAHSGAPGAITITTEYDTFSGAFGNLLTGGNITANANFVIPAN